MKRRIAIVVLALLATSAVASPKTYRYKCPKCHLIQEYSVPGSKKCPNDGHIMIRQN